MIVPLRHSAGHAGNPDISGDSALSVGEGGVHMMNIIKQSIFALLIGSVLAFQGAAQTPASQYDYQKDKKPNERPKEKEKEPKKDDKKDDKKKPDNG
jgi:hypothetical protein